MRLQKRQIPAMNIFRGSIYKIKTVQDRHNGFLKELELNLILTGVWEMASDYDH